MMHLNGGLFYNLSGIDVICKLTNNVMFWTRMYVNNNETSHMTQLVNRPFNICGTEVSTL